MSQFDLNFENTGPDGLNQWRIQRDRAMQRLARRLGLPLGHEVELWLKSGICLKGKLQLREETLFVETDEDRDTQLTIGRTDFKVSEIDSCVRLD